MTDLGMAGPAESQYLYHFTGRNGNRPAWVPEDICKMDGPERLNTMLREEQFRAFVPFGAGSPDNGGMPCLCFAECSVPQLGYLITMGLFQPWGVVGTRAAANQLGGGTVAYVPSKVQEQFKAKGMGHWAVRTEQGSTWMHEREWRIPVSTGQLKIGNLAAILVGDPAWRPRTVFSGRWLDQSTSEEVPGPDEYPHAVPVLDYPRLWLETPVWVWDKAAQALTYHAAGELR